MSKTSNGFTYLPDSFQMKNIYVDVLFRLLTPSESVILTIACREILGWEHSRQTKRSRIAQSIFTTKSGLSRNTLRVCLDELAKANILHPVGDLNNDGQEYELNTGEKGAYDFSYLNERTRGKNGNSAPIQGLSAMHAVSKQTELALPYMGVEGGSNFDTSKIDPYQMLISGGSNVDQQGDQHLIRSKPKTTEKGIDLPTEISIIFADVFFNKPKHLEAALQNITVTQHAETFSITLMPGFDWKNLNVALERAAKKYDTCIELICL